MGENMFRKKVKSHGRRLLVLVSVVMCLTLLVGCGEEPFELEKNEQDIIVNYAAHIVAKYNTKQPEGYTYVYPKEEKEEEEETPETETDPEDTKEDSKTQPEGTTSAETNPSSEQETVSLTKALGLKAKSVTAVYTGTELTDHYETVVPSAGGQLMIVHVTLKNKGDKKVKVNLLKEMPIFRATINEKQQVTADLTLLDNDLSTLEKTIKPGKAVDAVIVFSIGDTELTAVNQLTMSVNIGGKKSIVEFL